MDDCRQLTLSGFDLRLLCPICGQPVNLLGQVHPKLKYRACPNCCRKYALPTDAWGAEWQEQPFEVKARFVEVETKLRNHFAKPFSHNMFKTVVSDFDIHQMRFPVCDICGRVHNRMLSLFVLDYDSTCQECEDKEQVERLFTMRGMWQLGETEIEGQLDKLYRAFPDLFERGVLPDMWFRLLMEEQNGKTKS